ncbi:GNAT family N-acetyltransferase [Martelella alba]|uniref:GNAT family N-acetyltransferase n=1 Tax=Martelella alba TaxID=2590451 RepID=A0ABY2SNQ7_9HYPH|nr:GNAT family N-acetyltransferase [Martelella alba]TKI07427.1 GNAT family N-acetyltransferase [Martelella alba]
MLQLRAARIDELDKLTELCLQSKAVYGYDDDFMRCCRETLTFHPADVESSSICVAECDRELLGAAQLFFSEGNAILQRLFVSPAKTRHGIGKALFGWSLQMAHRAGARRLLIDCDPQAAGFFRRMGARPEGVVDSNIVPDRRMPRYQVTLSSRRPPSAE